MIMTAHNFSSHASQPTGFTCNHFNPYSNMPCLAKEIVQKSRRGFRSW